MVAKIGNASWLFGKLDWVFTSTSWSLSYPDTKVIPLDRPISDHVPYIVEVTTIVPKANIFRFENLIETSITLAGENRA
jgi:hypothetical protein